MTLKDSTDFVVSVNPTGVVMWYVSAPAKLSLRQFYKGGRLQGSNYNDDENAIPRVFLWPPNLNTQITSFCFSALSLIVLTGKNSHVHCVVLKALLSFFNPKVPATYHEYGTICSK